MCIQHGAFNHRRLGTRLLDAFYLLFSIDPLSVSRFRFQGGSIDKPRDSLPAHLNPLTFVLSYKQKKKLLTWEPMSINLTNQSSSMSNIYSTTYLPWFSFPFPIFLVPNAHPQYWAIASSYNWLYYRMKRREEKKERKKESTRWWWQTTTTTIIAWYTGYSRYLSIDRSSKSKSKSKNKVWMWLGAFVSYQCGYGWLTWRYMRVYMCVLFYDIL